ERVEVESVTAEAPSAGFVPFDAQGDAEAAPVGLAPGPLVEPLRREDRPPMVIRVIYQDADGRVVEERAGGGASAPPDSSGPAVDGVVRDSASQRQNLQELLQLVEQARLTET